MMSSCYEKGASIQDNTGYNSEKSAFDESRE